MNTLMLSLRANAFEYSSVYFELVLFARRLKGLCTTVDRMTCPAQV